MRWKSRLLFFAVGLIAMLIATAQVSSGHFVFDNASYHQPTYAWAGYGVGAVFCLLAFSPTNEWMERHITTKKPRKRNKPKAR
jgi:uncharacterized membrane protein YdcZ (DUF606 family)